MDFDQLNTFVEVAKHGSFSLAGRKVFRSQSAVSAQIRQLEQEYGEKLFGRMGKTVRLTPAGEVLFEYAERFLSLRQESLRAVADQSEMPRGHFGHWRERGHLPLRACPRFSPNFTAAIPTCRSASTAISATRFCSEWKTERIDLGIVTLPVKSPSLKVHSIYRDRVMLMVSTKNPLSKQKEVTAKDIASQPLIFPKTGFTRQVLDKVFRPYVTELRIVMELPSVTMIKLFVGANLGVSLISEGFTKDDVRAGRVKLIPIKDVELWRELGLIYRRDRHLPRSASAFADLIRGADGKSEAKPESKDGKPEEGV